jgi:uncharacterized protein YegJ (DUF2314 family)
MTSKGYAMILSAAAAAGLTVTPSPANGQSLLDKAERDEIVIVARTDPTMAAAMRKARASLGDFLALARNPRPGMEGFAVKVAIRQGDDAEYFWIHPFEHDAGRFSGQLNNTPRSVRNVKMGDRIAFTEQEIVDWIYLDGGRMKGNYTACALLKNASPQEREAFKRRFGHDCDF